VRVKRQQCGVLGDALIAACATGHTADLVETAERWQAPVAEVAPDPTRRAAYRDLLEAYRNLAPGLEPVFASLARTRSNREEQRT
jgi:sugar (pentulose or hexulose) kinase